MITIEQQIIPAMAGGAIALLAMPWLARVGVWGVRQWLDQGMACRLRRVEPVWWPATGLLALAMTLGPGSGAMLAAADGLAPAAMIGLLAALLIQLARIDAHCRLLPDPLTLALIASGLLFHGLFMPHGLIDSLMGAAFGYGLLWALAAIFQKLRGIEAMGRGDFAMTAGIGAWMGWQGLPFVLVLACIFALSFTAIRAMFKKKWSSSAGPFLSEQLAFGPALSAGAACAWVALG